MTMRDVIGRAFLVLTVLLLAGCTTTVVSVDPAIPTGTLYGEIISFDRITDTVRLDGYTVRLFNDAASELGSQVTDSSGRFRFDGLRSGNYEVRVSKDGYAEARKQQIPFVAPGTLILTRPINVVAIPLVTITDPYFDSSRSIDDTVIFGMLADSVTTKNYQSLRMLLTLYTVDANGMVDDSVQFFGAATSAVAGSPMYVIRTQYTYLRSELPGYHGKLLIRIQPGSEYSYYDIYARKYHYAVGELTPLIPFTLP